MGCLFHGMLTNLWQVFSDNNFLDFLPGRLLLICPVVQFLPLLTNLLKIRFDQA
jgi:hypothetical protein